MTNSNMKMPINIIFSFCMWFIKLQKLKLWFLISWLTLSGIHICRIIRSIKRK